MSALGRKQTLPRSIAMSAPGALSFVRANLNYSALCGVKEDRSNDASVEGETEDSTITFWSFQRVILRKRDRT
jgi:hypothetical protein